MSDAEVGKELRRAVDSGKVLFGLREARKSILKGTAQLVIVSANAKKGESETVRQLCGTSSAPFYQFNATGLQLGSLCGKPFVVSFATVEKAGKSKLLEAAAQKKGKQ
ncbi:MAG: 50S ribosomal protein L30e [Candidatus Diapherotrites archaeon]|nr:50S ribosomal protein L30e [Candidatus Diapherotrites archaeon]